MKHNLLTLTSQKTIFMIVLSVLISANSAAQNRSQQFDQQNDQTRQALGQNISIDLRDATLLEALFAVRDASGLNLVVGNEVTGTVNASFSNSSVHQVLDSLLLTRGYGYRVISGSISVVPLDNLGDQLPMFETEIIQLDAASAEELLPTIESLLSPEGRVHAITSSNSLVLMDYADQIRAAKTQINSLEAAAKQHQTNRVLNSPAATTVTAGGAITRTVVRVFTPQYISAPILAQGITPLLSPVGQLSALELEDKLVVTDTSETVERISLAIEQLDRPRPQVRIRALIYDCSLEDAKRLGVNLTSGVNGTSSASQSLVMNSLTAAAPTAGAVNSVLTLTSLNRFTNLEMVLQALETDDDSRLLADPNVVVMNHEAAAISIVTEIPYQQLTQGLEGGTIGTTAFREAGVTLNVTPHIAQDDTISMLVNPAFSLLTGFSDGDNAPIIDRRETTTTVRVQNNQTLVLGGLRQRTRIVEHSKVPGIGNIPYVGHLFRHKSNTIRESELLVFITPEIVYPDYTGSAREHCIGRNGTQQISQTPTGPIPFGKCAVFAEEEARTKRLDHICWDKNCRGGCRGECIQKPSECQECQFGMIESYDPIIETSTTEGMIDAPYSPQQLNVSPVESVPVPHAIVNPDHAATPNRQTAPSMVNLPALPQRTAPASHPFQQASMIDSQNASAIRYPLAKTGSIVATSTVQPARLLRPRRSPLIATGPPVAGTVSRTTNASLSAVDTHSVGGQRQTTPSISTPTFSPVRITPATQPIR